MRATKLVNGLALSGALVALAGVFLAANAALAAEKDTVDTTAVAIHDAAETTAASARDANRDAAEEAAAAVLRANRLDLDIRLLGHSSGLIAESR